MVVGEQNVIGFERGFVQRRFGVDKSVGRAFVGEIRVDLNDGAVGVFEGDGGLAEPVDADFVFRNSKFGEGVHWVLLHFKEGLWLPKTTCGRDGGYNFWMRGAIVKAFWARDLAKQEDDRYIMGPTTDIRSMTLAQEDYNILDEIPMALEERMPVWRENGEQLQINEIFYSIEGEGYRVGQPTTFVRLSRCNLRCFFCDTEFDSFVEMPVVQVLEEVQRHSANWVCLTGGEPLGQNITPLCRMLQDAGYRLHIETNGTVDPNPELLELIEHWTVSPKREEIVSGLTRITELKYIVGKAFRENQVEEGRADYIYLQPESSKPEYIHKTLEILLRHPDWRLSCRIHKVLKLP